MPAKPNEIPIIRLYNAPVKLVWEVWTDLKHVAKWWGPRGFTLTTHCKDFRSGGKWIYTMHGPDGTDYPNITTYHEIVDYKKLVYDHGGNEERQKLFTVTATFEEQGNKTLLTLSFALPTEEEAKAMKEFIRLANGNSTWDRLGEYLEMETEGRDIFIINHSFSTSVEKLFEMWVTPELFAQWLGPAGCRMHFIEASVREGGTAMWEMTTSDGNSKFWKLHYRKICPPYLLEYTQSFCDKNGNFARHPMADPYPGTLRTLVTFAEEDAGEARVTVMWEVYGESTEAERKTFHNIKPVMMKGWTESFDKLRALLALR
ncbi:hypothetical protein DB346_20665 [Verrucomicrobia bacterium LW23]|nr:hypothetical protein DB346_20665 [Verrucomicrobia bacterium LW23]